MAAPVDVSEVVNRLTGGNGGTPESFFWHKEIGSGFTMSGGVWTSLWTADGYPGPGANPTTVAIPTNATAGAFRHTNPSGGRKRWLRSVGASAWSPVRMLIYDRLLHIGGLSGTVTTAQTVGTDVTRYTGQDSIGNIAMAEIYSQIGATQVNISCNYLDKDGNSVASPSALIGATAMRNAGQCVFLPYGTSAGQNSVTRVTDVTLSATTGTAGNFGITIIRPLFEVVVGSVDTSGFGHGALATVVEDIELKTDACLGVLFMPTGSTVNWVRGNYTSLES